MINQINNMAEIKFIKGLYVERKENAPEFVVTNLSIKSEEFIEFVKDNTNNKWYLNIDIQTSKSSWKQYAKLNEWKPKSKEGIEPMEWDEDISIENIPF